VAHLQHLHGIHFGQQLGPDSLPLVVILLQLLLLRLAFPFDAGGQLVVHLHVVVLRIQVGLGLDRLVLAIVLGNVEHLAQLVLLQLKIGSGCGSGGGMLVPVGPDTCAAY